MMATTNKSGTLYTTDGTDRVNWYPVTLAGNVQTEGGSDVETQLAAKYVKPSGGIPKTDFAGSAQEAMVPSGGSYGQVLKKSSGTDYDVEWADESGGGGGLTSDIKDALLQIAAKIAYIDDDGEYYYNELHDVFYPLLSISAVYTQSGSVYPSTPLDSLKTDLVVTASYSDNTTRTIPSADYTLSGTLSAGTSTVTVTYYGKTTTFSVTVSSSATLSSISAAYTPSGAVYTDTTLDSLKTDLVVTAHYSDSSSATVASADYTLSGTLTVGTSAITVTYESKTTTFNVTVTAILYPFENGTYVFTLPTSTVEVTNGDTAKITTSSANKVATHANVSEISLNTTACDTSDNYKGMSSPYFTLSANSTLSVTMTVTSVTAGNSNAQAAVAFRDMNGAAVMIMTGWGTNGTNKKLNTLTVGDTFTTSYTAETSTNIGCVGVWLGRSTSSTVSVLGLKFRAFVDGVRII